MKILFLAHRLPCPPDRGAKLRAATLLKYLARRHEVYCAGFIDDRENPQAVEQSLAQWRSLCREVAAVRLNRPLAGLQAIAGLCLGATASESYFHSRRLETIVTRWGQQHAFDAVLAFSSSMAPLALKVPAQRRVLDMDDLDSAKWLESAHQGRRLMRPIYAIEGRRLAACEKKWLATFDASLFINQKEADLVTDPQLQQRVHLFEGISSPGMTGDDAQGERKWQLPDEPLVGFLGAMDYGPNIDAACWFYQEIWPLLQQHNPSAHWWVIGRSPGKAIRRLDNGRNLRVTGTVPEVEPYLARLRVHVAPLRLARGMQIKVLTAMAAGVPSVVTPCVARGLNGQDGRHYVVAESPAEFAMKIDRLLKDRPYAEAIAAAGRAFARTRYAPEQGLQLVEQLLTGPAREAEAQTACTRKKEGSRSAVKPAGQPSLTENLHAIAGGIS